MLTRSGRRPQVDRLHTRQIFSLIAANNYEQAATSDGGDDNRVRILQLIVSTNERANTNSQQQQKNGNVQVKIFYSSARVLCGRRHAFNVTKNSRLVHLPTIAADNKRVAADVYEFEVCNLCKTQFARYRRARN